MKVAIVEHGFQRNGVTGEPFYIFRLQLGHTVHKPDGETVLATIGFAAEGTEYGDRLDGATCRVVNPNELDAGYRGDEISDALFRALWHSGLAAQLKIDVTKDLR